MNKENIQDKESWYPKYEENIKKYQDFKKDNDFLAVGHERESNDGLEINFDEAFKCAITNMNITAQRFFGK